MNNKGALPFLFICAGLASGIILWSFNASWWYVPAFLITAFVGYIFVIKQEKTVTGAIRYSKFNWIWVYFLFTSLGLANAYLNGPDKIDLTNGTFSNVAFGEVESVSESTSGQQIIFKVLSLSEPDGSKTNYLHDSRAIIYCYNTNLEVSDKFYYRHNLQRIEDDLNYQRHGYAQFMAARGILWYDVVSNVDLHLVQPNHDFRYWCWRIQLECEQMIDNCDINIETRSFLKTILLGFNNQDNITAENALRDAGISHILAVSGLHMGIIASFLYFLTAPLVFLGQRNLRWYVIFVLLWVYVCLCGFHTPAIRAAIMLSMILFARVFQRKNNSINALCAASAIILLYNPIALFDVGLQMSVLCVASIIGFTHEFFPQGDNHRALWQRCLYPMAVSLTAVFGTWALTAFYFHSFPLMFLPANFIILPLLPIYIITATIDIIFSAIGINLNWLHFLLDYSYNAMINFCHFLGSGTVFTLHVHWITPLLWFVGLSILWIAFRLNRKVIPMTAAICCFCLAIASTWIITSSKPIDGIIVKSHPNNTAIVEYINGFEHEIVFQNGNETSTLISNYHIVVTASSEGYARKQYPNGCDILIIRDGNNEKPEHLLNRIRPQIVVIRPDVNEYKADEIMVQSLKAGAQFTNLRYDGPLRLFTKTYSE